RAIPGQRVTLSLGRVHQITRRMLSQHQQADALLAAALKIPSGATTPIPTPEPRAVVTRVVSLKVAHRSVPLAVTLVEPANRSNGRLVLVSHGLWDTPTYFRGWATLLASRGYTVLLPRHPGSDTRHQFLVLAGKAVPPRPEELALRPRDLLAVLNAAASDLLPLAHPVASDRVVVFGHSWGATTALQFAGVKPGDKKLLKLCSKLNEPARNLSWILQCSWLKAIHNSMVSDPRVIAVAAVSPPVSLVFPRGSIANLTGRVLLVSGNRDWVVPPDPEAIAPMRRARLSGNQLVLVKGGDHFNLRPGDNADGGLLGPLLLAWTNAAFAAGPAVRPRPGASPLLKPQSWGTANDPIRDVTTLLVPSTSPVSQRRS
ncbi:MAG: alpha/beta fold hydrolase, partial [Synechococcus sp. ELA057]